MKKNFSIPLHPPCVDQTAHRSVDEVLRSGWVAPGGPWVRKFEKSLSKHTGKMPVAVQSGTAALHLALRALGIGEGDTVLVPTHTYVASVSPLRYVGARPVLVESDPESINISPDYVEKSIELLHRKGIRPRAVITVHLYGLPAAMDRLTALSEKYRLLLIEDAAEAMGTLWDGRQTGTLAEAGIFSFNGNKTITAGGGGAVVFGDTSLNAQVRKWAAHARERRPYFYHRETGYNYQMSALNAGLGIASLKKYPQIIATKRDLHRFYVRALENLPLMPVEEPAGSRSNYWLNAFLLAGGYEAGALISHLQSRGIEARHFWYPLHRMPLFRETMYVGQGESEELFRRGILLPSAPCLTEEQKERIVTEIQDWFSRR